MLMIFDFYITTMPYCSTKPSPQSTTVQPPRSLRTLQDHISKLEAQYDILNEELANGENQKFSAEPDPQLLAHLIQPNLC